MRPPTALPPPGPHWDRISTLFHEAVSLEPHRRAAFLDEACGADAVLLAQVRALVRSHEDLERDETAGGPGTSFLDSLDPSRVAALLDSAPALPKAGDRVGRYRILKPLGRGGMGEVFLAHDPVLDRSVALKLLPAWAGRDRRLLAEARAAAALDHPHIGTVYEVGRTSEHGWYMAMASYEAGSLRARLASGPLPVLEAVEVAGRVAEALAAAHDAGIVHRDIKPENLVFDGDGRVKVVDFGIARTELAADATSRRGGTRPYMSPEQVEGEAGDARSDQWTLGVVLYEMLAGRRPFEETDEQTLVESIRRGRRPGLRSLRREVPEEVAEVVERALQRDPSRRFPDAAAMGRALCAARASVRASPEPRRRGRRWTAAVAGMVLVGLVAAGALHAGRALTGLTASQASSGGGPGDSGRVVVADFQASDELADVATAAREALTVDLQQSRHVTALSRPETASILQRIGLPADTTVDGALALEVAERAGAGAVVEANVARVGSRFVLSGRALAPGTGQELFAVRTTADPQGLLGGVEDLSRQLRRQLGERAESLARSRPLPEVTTASLDALRLYAEAERALQVDNARAYAFLGAALERDSTFAMAHRLAATIAVARLEFAAAAEHMESAWRHRNRLPEQERLHVDAMYASEVSFDPWRAIEALELLQLRYPHDGRAVNNDGIVRFNWMSDPEGALDALLRARTLEPGRATTLANLIQLSWMMGRRSQADSLAALGRDEGLEAFLERWQILRAFALGDGDATAEGCQALLDRPERPGPLNDDLEICGSIDLAEGRLQRARERLEASSASSLEAGRLRNVAQAAQALAAVELARGDATAAEERLLAAMDILPAEGFREPDRFIVRTNLRVQAALHGWERAEGRARLQYPAHPDPDHWFGKAGEGLVQAAEAVRRGDGAEALAHLDEAFPPGIMPIGWRVLDDLLRGLAHELEDRPAPAARHLGRAADRNRAVFSFMTKERIHLAMAEDALARVTPTAPP